ncbi:MAG: PepSY-like domain-containing protein [Bacteroidales bacterium]|nr:PepSY-like domain-containing protein [Bacteroidales bacterium]
MKNLLLISLLFSCVFAYSQVSDLPQTVLTAQKDKYPNSKIDDWSLTDDGNYSMDFYISTNFYTSVFDKEGIWKETSEVIADEDAPSQLKDYLSKNYPGYKVSYTEKVQTSGSSIFIRVTFFLNGNTSAVQSDDKGNNIKVIK